uniref:ADP-ribosylation factor-like protein 2-binding protein n=1 Tax=Gallus gallus TaxID=9031 RepID=A0A8V1A989_CHICK
METSEEENFGVAVSSPSDAEFDAVVGYLEDIIMDDDFQSIQRTFMEKHYQEFDDSEENKLIYTSIFNEYISLIEKYIEEKLLDRIPGFNMTAFTMSLQQHKDEMAGDIFDMLLTFTDFLAFKEMFLDYRAVRKRRSESGFKWWISGDITKQIISLLLLEQLVHCFPSPDECYCCHWDIKTQKVTRIKVLLCDENSLSDYAFRFLKLAGIQRPQKKKTLVLLE